MTLIWTFDVQSIKLAKLNDLTDFQAKKICQSPRLLDFEQDEQTRFIAERPVIIFYYSECKLVKNH